MKKLSFKILIFCFLTLFIAANPLAAFADITPSPAQITPVFDYTGNPGYSAYYNFAKYHLFDGQDFFTSNSSGNFVQCPIATPSDETALNRQLATWGFTVEGAAETPDLLQETFATVCLLNQSSFYVDHLGALKNTVIISFDSRDGGGGGCTDYVPSNQDCVGGNEEPRSYDHEPIVHLFNSRANATEENRFFLSHELGHVFSSRNDSVQESFNTDIFSSAPRLTSINCSIQQDITNEQNECFADAIGLYLVYPSFTAWASDVTDTNNYPTGKYKAYYDFVKTSIFGNVDFFSSASTNQIAQYATDLNISIQHSCPPPYTTALGSRTSIVNGNDMNCLNTLDMNPVPDPKVITTLKSEILNYGSNPVPTLQCVGFAEAVSVGVGADIGSTDASAYAGKPISGYKWIPNTPDAKIQPGDIMVWGLGSDGCQHIAVVTNTSGDDGLSIAEANGWDGDVTIVNTSRSHEQSWCPLKGWQRKQ